MNKRWTIVGGRGFIGSALAATLRASGAEVAVATHADDLAGIDLGHVIYASGVAATAVSDPGYAVRAHVSGVERILTGSRIASLLYLSSTRVYGSSPDTGESAPLAVEPGASDVYRITKIAGEALVLASHDPAMRVARLSNVAGANVTSPLFLNDVLRQAASTGRAAVRTLPASAKDYLSIGDACGYLIAIATAGSERIYNVAAGRNTENGAIYDALERLGIAIDIDPAATVSVVPRIDAGRLHDAFGPPREDLIASLPSLLERFRDAVRTAPV